MYIHYTKEVGPEPLFVSGERFIGVTITYFPYSFQNHTLSVIECSLHHSKEQW